MKMIMAESKKKKIKPEIRYLKDLEKVIFDKEWFKKTKNFPVYYMYRGIKRKDKLRYDITEIPAKMFGKEFPKTKGHEHCQNFQEIYTVLKGEALYLAQKCQGKKVLDVFAVFAKKGESVLIPKGYGHITINPSNNTLREANWVSENCKNIYNLFEKMNGACYFYTIDGWIKNKNYKNIPKLRFEKPLKKLPKDLSFLNNG